MQKQKTVTIFTEPEFEGFHVEVSQCLHDENLIEFYLCHKDYGVKSLMFEAQTKDCPENIWEDMIKNNIEENVNTFMEEYMDE